MPQQLNRGVEMQIVLEIRLSGMGGDGFQVTREELEEGACDPPTIHSSGNCLNLLSWALRVSLRQKLHSINFLVQNNFKHN